MPVNRRVLKPLLVATVVDSEGRLIWADNSGVSPAVLNHLMTEAARIALAVTTLEDKGHRLAWDWQGCVERAPKL